VSLAARLYLITDGWEGTTAERVDAALAALPAGTAAVQLRAKALPGGALLAAARQLSEITRARGALLFINDRIDVALAAGADGAHLPVSGLPPQAARRVGGPGLHLGCSTHSLAEAQRAVAGGADFVTFGPVWPTASKAAYGPPVGPEQLAEAVAALPVPVFALGGVDATRAARCAELGAGVACIGAVLGQDDPGRAARALGVSLGLL
jgi:thiamine-phosphate pyrophosphorylase